MPTPSEIDAGRVADDLRAVVRGVVGDETRVGLHEPEIGEVEHEFLTACLDSTFVSSVGPFIIRFEEEIAAYTGAAHAIAVSNGTVGLQVALTLAGVQAGDAVLVPALSFIATANAVRHAGAVPVFLDSEESTLGLDPDAVEAYLAGCRREGDRLVDPVEGRRIAAVVPMHTLGHPTRIARLVEVVERVGVPVVEDAAESLGSFVGDRHTGRFGALGMISFNGNKILTTGGGGMIITDDPELARRAKHLTTTAKLPHAWAFEHDEVAWNFRMPNLNAALGVAQLTRLPQQLERKRRLASRYRDALAGIEGLTFLDEPEGTSSNYWLCAVRIDGADLAVRDHVLRVLNEDGLQARPFWNLLSDQAPYRDAPRGELPVARALADSVVCIPSSPWLADR